MKDKLLQVGINTYKWASLHHTFLPRIIEVETTKACNLRCPGCRRNYKEGGIASEPGATHLTVDAIRKAVEAVPCKIVSFEGDGEPLCNPHLRDIVSFLHKSGIRCSMTSNGTLLDEDWIKFLEKNGMFRIHVSFDGATKETYEKMRVGGTFEDTLHNCKLIGNSKIQLFMSIVLFTDELIKELPKYIEQAKDVKATGIHFMKVQADSPDFIMPDYSKHQDLIRSFKEMGKKAGLIMVGSSTDKPTFRRCYYPFFFPFILLNNDVYACNYMANLRRTEVYMNEVFKVPYQEYRMGNLNNNTLREIWNNELYKELRQALRVKPNRAMESDDFLLFMKRKLSRGEIPPEFKDLRFSFCVGCLCQWGESGL